MTNIIFLTPHINGARYERPATEGSEFDVIVSCFHIRLPLDRLQLSHSN